MQFTNLGNSQHFCLLKIPLVHEHNVSQSLDSVACQNVVQCAESKHILGIPESRKQACPSRWSCLFTLKVIEIVPHQLFAKWVETWARHVSNPPVESQNAICPVDCSCRRTHPNHGSNYLSGWLWLQHVLPKVHNLPTSTWCQNVSLQNTKPLCDSMFALIVSALHHAFIRHICNCTHENMFTQHMWFLKHTLLNVLRTNGSSLPNWILKWNCWCHRRKRVMPEQILENTTLPRKNHACHCRILSYGLFNEIWHWNWRYNWRWRNITHLHRSHASALAKIAVIVSCVQHWTFFMQEILEVFIVTTICIKVMRSIIFSFKSRFVQYFLKRQTMQIWIHCILWFLFNSTVNAATTKRLTSVRSPGHCEKPPLRPKKTVFSRKIKPKLKAERSSTKPHWLQAQRLLRKWIARPRPATKWLEMDMLLQDQQLRLVHERCSHQLENFLLVSL